MDIRHGATARLKSLSTTMCPFYSPFPLAEMYGKAGERCYLRDSTRLTLERGFKYHAYVIGCVLLHDQHTNQHLQIEEINRPQIWL